MGGLHGKNWLMRVKIFINFVPMSKRTETNVNSAKSASKHHDKFVVSASFEELMKMAVNTPPLKKRKKKDA